MTVIIELYHNDSMRLVDSWQCDDRSIVDSLGTPDLSLSDGSILYYNYGGQWRLLIDLNVTSV